MPRPRDSTISYSSFLQLLQPDTAVESVFSRVPLVLQLVYQALKAFSCILLAIAETLAEEAAAQAFLLLLFFFFYYSMWVRMCSFCFQGLHLQNATTVFCNFILQKRRRLLLCSEVVSVSFILSKRRQVVYLLCAKILICLMKSNIRRKERKK